MPRPDLHASLAKEEFDLHLTYLTESGKSFISSTSAVAGFLLAAIGWLATSDTARSYLSSHAPVAWLAACAVAVACILFAAASWILFAANHRTYEQLRRLDYLPWTAYEARRLRPVTLLVCLLGVSVIGSLLALLLLLV